MRYDFLNEEPPAVHATYGRLKWVLVDYDGKPGMKLWRGRSKRPERNRFLTVDARDRYMASIRRAEDSRQHVIEERRAEEQRRTASMCEQIQVGTLLHYSWGYEQTQCEYYQVVGRRGRAVTLRRIGSKVVEGSEGFMSDRRTPERDRFIGESFQKRITGCGISMEHGIASPCADDEANYCSWYA
jgi:hypothetical protein